MGKNTQKHLIGQPIRYLKSEKLIFNKLIIRNR